MSDVYDPTRLGQANNTGDTDALFLKVFSNEILATFEKTQIMKPLHTIRTISSGKSATFATIGTATAAYHTPGENIMTKSHDHDADGSTAEVSKYTTNFNMNEQVVNIDKMLVSSTFIPNIDELKNHFDVRGQFSKELGTALAQRFDRAVLKTLAAGATDSSAQPSGQPSGINFNGATSTGAELVSTIAKIAQLLDENDVPDDGTRFAILKPEEYYKLVSTDNIAIQKDYGGSGGVAAGNIPQIAGINIFKSNNLKAVAVATQPDSDDSSSNNDVFGASGAGYNPTNLSSTVILGGHPSAVGTVKLLDLATESDYSVQHQGTLMVAKYAMGHAVLRAGACVNVT
tara:strand:+ start:283 stop:1314 length:1032 start_codon:yes stop_codon:yes gene_type:complete